jgi:hypothetical protein
VEEIADVVDAAFRLSWTQRLDGAEEAISHELTKPPTCQWLYQNLTIDGAARIMPCCMAPDRQQKHLVFANFTDESPANLTALVNSPMARRARLAFGNRPAYEDTIRDAPLSEQPFCAACSENPTLYGLANVAGDIWNLDAGRAVPRSLRWALTSWS